MDARGCSWRTKEAWHRGVEEAPCPPAGAGGGGRPRRPRLPRGRPRSTLRRCAGSRPGSGWDRVGPARSRPRAPPAPRPARDRPAAVGGPDGFPARGPAAAPRPPDPAPAPLPRPRAAHRIAIRPGDRAAFGCPRPAHRRSTPAADDARSTRGSVGRWAAPGSDAAPSGAGRPGLPIRARERGAAGAVEWGARPRPLGRLGSGRLPAVHPPPIDPVVYRGPYLVPSGEALLGEGFPLRCFQRFARPNVATQRCRLPDNWPTSGSSSPVLSY